MDLIPDSLLELGQLLALPRNSKYAQTNRNQPFFLGSISNPNEGTSVIFGSQKFMNMLLTAQEYHVDGTFKVRPTVPPSRQLLTVMTMYYGKVKPFCLFLRKLKFHNKNLCSNEKLLTCFYQHIWDQQLIVTSEP